MGVDGALTGQRQRSLAAVKAGDQVMGEVQVQVQVEIGVQVEIAIAIDCWLGVALPI